MTTVELTNVLITILILVLGFIGGMIFKKLDRIEKDVQQAALIAVSHAKDIDRIDKQIVEHSTRISKVEEKLSDYNHLNFNT